jgi:hypothetical protein
MPVEPGGGIGDGAGPIGGGDLPQWILDIINGVGDDGDYNPPVGDHSDDDYTPPVGDDDDYTPPADNDSDVIVELDNDQVPDIDDAVDNSRDRISDRKDDIRDGNW